MFENAFFINEELNDEEKISVNNLLLNYNNLLMNNEIVLDNLVDPNIKITTGVSLNLLLTNNFKIILKNDYNASQLLIFKHFLNKYYNNNKRCNKFIYILYDFLKFNNTLYYKRLEPIFINWLINEFFIFKNYRYMWSVIPILCKFYIDDYVFEKRISINEKVFSHISNYINYALCNDVRKDNTNHHRSIVLLTKVLPLLHQYSFEERCYILSYTANVIITVNMNKFNIDDSILSKLTYRLMINTFTIINNTEKDM